MNSSKGNMLVHYEVRSPVLFLIFNRPDTTAQVFNELKKVRPSKLYIAADGPRKNNESDVLLCRQARAIAEQVDWDCKVVTLFNESNKGCRLAVSSAITWFFEQEEEGIILEDDCLPNQSFFRFCDILLERYRFDTRINSITGTNLQRGNKWGNGSYYFSQYANIWGWASWRRVWKKYDVSLLNYHEKDAAIALRKIFDDEFLVADWISIFKRLQSGEIDTWDYQFNFMSFFENALCATPNNNLISNIGFRSDATHTPDPGNHNAALPTVEMEEIMHPLYFVPEKEADYFFMKKEFNLEERWKKYNRNIKRFKRWMRNLLK